MKEERYPLDDRRVHLCGMRDGNVHVEWQEGTDVHDAKEIADEHLRRVLGLIAAGKEEEAIEHVCRTTRISRQEARQYVRVARKAMEGGGA
jgi:response regulator of citrate/malate metabolism